MSTDACSFCLRPEPVCGELMQGDASAGDRAARICGECALACAEALGAEKRIQEARRSQRPPRLEASGASSGDDADWSSFTVDGEPWEWHCRRVVSVARTPITRLSVRTSADDGATVVDLPEGTAPTEATARLVELAVRSWSVASPTELVRDWTTSAVEGRPFEWRVERASRPMAAERAVVHVRHVASGRTTSMEIAASAVATVDDAAMAAALLDTGGTRDPA